MACPFHRVEALEQDAQIGGHLRWQEGLQRLIVNGENLIGAIIGRLDHAQGHGPVGAGSLFDRFGNQAGNCVVAPVLTDHVEHGFHRIFGAFQQLHEMCTGKDQEPGDIQRCVAPLSGFQKMFKNIVAHVRISSADVKQTVKHGRHRRLLRPYAAPCRS